MVPKFQAGAEQAAKVLTPTCSLPACLGTNLSLQSFSPRAVAAGTICAGGFYFCPLGTTLGSATLNWQQMLTRIDPSWPGLIINWQPRRKRLQDLRRALISLSWDLAMCTVLLKTAVSNNILSPPLFTTSQAPQMPCTARFSSAYHYLRCCQLANLDCKTLLSANCILSFGKCSRHLSLCKYKPQYSPYIPLLHFVPHLPYRVLWTFSCQSLLPLTPATASARGGGGCCHIPLAVHISPESYSTFHSREWFSPQFQNNVWNPALQKQ